MARICHGNIFIDFTMTIIEKEVEKKKIIIFLRRIEKTMIREI